MNEVEIRLMAMNIATHVGTEGKDYDFHDVVQWNFDFLMDGAQKVEPAPVMKLVN